MSGDHVDQGIQSTILENTGFDFSETLFGHVCDLTQFDVFPAGKTMLVKKFFRAINRVVWFCFCTWLIARKNFFTSIIWTCWNFTSLHLTTN